MSEPGSSSARGEEMTRSKKAPAAAGDEGQEMNHVNK